jgi:hypothetical protein
MQFAESAFRSAPAGSPNKFLVAGIAPARTKEFSVGQNPALPARQKFSNAQISKESWMALLRSTPSHLLAPADPQNNIFTVNNCPEHS